MNTRISKEGINVGKNGTVAEYHMISFAYFLPAMFRVTTDSYYRRGGCLEASKPVVNIDLC